MQWYVPVDEALKWTQLANHKKCCKPAQIENNCSRWWLPFLYRRVPNPYFFFLVVGNFFLHLNWFRFSCLSEISFSKNRTKDSGGVFDKVSLSPHIPVTSAPSLTPLLHKMPLSWNPLGSKSKSRGHHCHHCHHHHSQNYIGSKRYLWKICSLRWYTHEKRWRLKYSSPRRIKRPQPKKSDSTT